LLLGEEELAGQAVSLAQAIGMAKDAETLLEGAKEDIGETNKQTNKKQRTEWQHGCENKKENNVRAEQGQTSSDKLF